MALFNTLSPFPGPIRHGSSAGAAVTTDLATLIRWYWRVRRWQMRLTVSGSYSGRLADGDGATASFSVDGATVTALFEPSNDGASGITSEYELIRQTSMVGTPDPVCTPGNIVTQNGAGGRCQVDSLYFSNVQGLGGPSAVYDPAAAVYALNQPTIAIVVVAADNSFLAVGLDAGGFDPVFYPSPFYTPVQIDGTTYQVPAVLGVEFSDGSSLPSPAFPTVTCAFTPVLWWGWGGKYDPATGARL